MKGDGFVMGELVGSISMNLGKGDSASLSKEESNSERFHFNFLFEKAIYIICFCWSYAPPPTTESKLCWECTKGETRSPWLRQGYITSILVLRTKF